MPKIDPTMVLDEIEELYDLIEQALEENDKGATFYDDVRSNAEDMESWIKENELATGKQLQAVRNWKDGVSKWLD